MALLTACLVGSPGQKVGVDLKSWTDTDLGGNVPFKAEATVSAGYSDISSIENWASYGRSTGLKRKEVKAEIKIIYDATSPSQNWASLTSDEKKVIAKYHMVNHTKRDEVLTLAEREQSTRDEEDEGLDFLNAPTVNDDLDQGFCIDDIITDTVTNKG